MRQRQPAGNRLFPLVAGVLLATATAWAGPRVGAPPTDRITVDLHEDVLELSWSDTEERLQGGIRPAHPRAGRPLTVSLEVGSFEGEDFTGPLVLTLREAGANHGQSITVKRGERHWEATFIPENPGPHLLDVNFRTTRAKFLHAAIEVGPSPVPRLLGWSMLALLGLVIVGYTVHGLLREQRKPAPQTPPEATPPPAAAAPPSPEPSAGPAPDAAPPPSPESAAPAEPQPGTAGTPPPPVPGDKPPAAADPDKAHAPPAPADAAPVPSPPPGTDSGGPTGQ